MPNHRTKYKREHFATQEEFDRYRKRVSEAHLRWLSKREGANPELRERRIMRQRLYSRYYWRYDGKQTFSQWLDTEFGVKDISSIPIEELRRISS